MTQLSRPSLFGLALVCFTVGSITASFAAEELPRLTPEAGVAAQIATTENGYVIVQPDGSELMMIDAEWAANFDGEPSFTVADFNFDGFPDVALGASTSESPDIGFGLFLYKPTTKSYAALNFTEDFSERLNCGALWNIELIESREAIKSSCSFEGEDARIDVVRIDPNGGANLLEQSSPKEEIWHWPYLDRPARMVSYDRQGNITLETVIASDEAENSWEVPVTTLEIYSAADLQSRTPGHLVKGESVRILAFSGDFMKFAREGSDNLPGGWVSLKEAYDLVAHYDADGTKPQTASLGLSDYKDTTENPDYYRNLFTLTMKNTSDTEIQLSNAELFLLFNGDNGTRLAHKLYDISDTTLTPGESHMLDDNPIEKRDGQFVIYHDNDGQDAYPLFFPTNLMPGKYRVRPIITGPGLGSFIYGENEIELEYPPKLADSLVKP
ncbi:hypothetical protein [Ochrobactrum sp. AN78]|uniref:hypothetical protein n=1 Tax=Ochrobactrum sp. AN78 TaxID=3039853 RepID=UPI002989AD7E|nr:hypothetical protein [Ochrobactrum sp. AN78]MDH7791459.1 hypothetical protein [Ochrobactrum sp. AN78]